MIFTTITDIISPLSRSRLIPLCDLLTVADEYHFGEDGQSWNPGLPENPLDNCQHVCELVHDHLTGGLALRLATLGNPKFQVSPHREVHQPSSALHSAT